MIVRAVIASFGVWKNRFESHGIATFYLGTTNVAIAPTPPRVSSIAAQMFFRDVFFYLAHDPLPLGARSIVYELLLRKP